ncbi:MAG: hypothetical protein NTX35_21580 [Verrucomicrobia bacterium]|nr:hypothetical protein [Verrucomicrobiota bacterium]
MALLKKFSAKIVLAMMGGAKETIPRAAIQDLKSLDCTLMPDGLEAAITNRQGRQLPHREGSCP